MWGFFSKKTAIKDAKVPPGTRIYAIGDVHGRVDLLQQTISEIDQHRNAYPIANPIEILLGDYVDRGPRSDAVIEQMRSTLHPPTGVHAALVGLPVLAAKSGAAVASPWRLESRARRS